MTPLELEDMRYCSADCQMQDVTECNSERSLLVDKILELERALAISNDALAASTKVLNIAVEAMEKIAKDLK